ncbi:MAG: M48 family metallopeptidase [Sterolibacterium sp.]
MSYADDFPKQYQSPTPETYAGVYYDGKSSARQAVSLAIAGDRLEFQGEAWSRQVAASAVSLSNPLPNAPLFLYLDNGGCCELPCSPRLQDQLDLAGVSLGGVPWLASVLEGDWRLVAMSTTFLIVAIAAIYVWLLPAVATVGAMMVPTDVQSGFGETVLRQLENKWFQPTGLSSEQQEKIQKRFLQLVDKQPGKYVLHIRKSGIGPNALALPGNMVVLTDELITLVGGDLDAVSGILAHELGHARANHVMRSLIQGSALTVLGSALIGDYSSILATAPAVLGQLRYSREFESEADRDAQMLLCAQGIDPAGTALFFDKISAKEGNLLELLPEYLKTHPNSAKRAEFFRSGC